MNEQKFHIGIKALIVNGEGKILLPKANPAELKGNAAAHWDIPGGRIKQGSSVEETLKNEIKEELGVNEVEIGKLFDASIANLKIPLGNGEEVGLALFTYKCKLPENSVIKLSSEHTEYKWASVEEAKKQLEKLGLALQEDYSAIRELKGQVANKGYARGKARVYTTPPQLQRLMKATC